MKMTKKFAVAFAALLAASALVSCNQTKNPDEDVPSNDDTVVTPSSPALTLADIDKRIEEKVGKTEADGLVLMTLGDYNVTYSEYRYYYINNLQQYIYYYGLDEGEDSTWKDTFDNIMEESLKMSAVVANTALHNGIQLTEDEFNTAVVAVYDSIAEQYGDETVTTLDQSYAVTPYYMMMNESVYNLYLKLFDFYYGEGGERSADVRKETLDYYTENDYVRAKHVLIKYPENEDGSELTEEQKAETLAKANEVLEKAKNGEDFDALITEYNEDPGVTSNPDGYYFGKGQMVEPFENAAYALADGEISGLVETDFGYHIIKRLPIDDEKLVNTQEYNQFAYNDFDDFFVDEISKVEFVPVENFDELVQPILDEGEAYIAEMRAQMQPADDAE